MIGRGNSHSLCCIETLRHFVSTTCSQKAQRRPLAHSVVYPLLGSRELFPHQFVDWCAATWPEVESNRELLVPARNRKEGK
jgi:hypothetical protein